MMDPGPKPDEALRRTAGGPVEQLAGRALALLAKRRTVPRTKLSETFVTRFQEAVLAHDPGRRSRLIAVMREAHIADDAIVDHYVPEVARRIGVDWVENRLSFAEVTVASARLQAVVRELLTALDPGGPDDPAIAVFVPPGDTHTLGATVVASQLRRRGASVRLMLDPDDALPDGPYDAVFVSVAASVALANLPDFVKKLRAAYGGTPIVVGGAVLDRTADTKGRTGADFETSDCAEALALCGLRTSRAARTPSGAVPTGMPGGDGR